MSGWIWGNCVINRQPVIFFGPLWGSRINYDSSVTIQVDTELVRQQLPSDKHKSMNHACLWSLSTLGVKISMSLADTYSTMFTSTFSLKTAACCGQKQCCESSEREPAKLKV